MLIFASISNLFLQHYCKELQPKSVVKNRKSEFDGLFEEKEATSPQATGDSCQPNNLEPRLDSNVSVLISENHGRKFIGIGRLKRIQWDQRKC